MSNNSSGGAALAASEYITAAALGTFALEYRRDKLSDASKTA
jgi:hypothetical protein